MTNILVVGRKNGRCVMREIANVREGQSERVAEDYCKLMGWIYLHCFRTYPGVTLLPGIARGGVQCTP